MGIGDKIRQRREAIGMSQAELANKLGYTSRSSINKIEKDINDIPQSKIIAFAEALETTPAFLMDWKEEQNDNQSRIWKNVKLAREKNNISQEELAELANIPLDLIKEIEENKKIPDYELIIKLTKALNCEIHYIFFGEEIEELENYDFTTFEKIDAIMASDDEARKKVVKASIEFNDEDIMLLERIIDALNTKRTD